ncbi:hypothetical protein DPMN_108331 [Dreissena polymorpha]|uniref:Uncharacterized protein n=1 Tax=Dreissena polymorpha TaxID=45954 RepID=A0A9D4K8D6_DREPO|nr:hypothetical protein DPMN_108331 [Dreissena polymorpha]
MTCKLALTRMSTTDDVQAGSDSDMYPEDNVQAAVLFSPFGNGAGSLWIGKIRGVLT